MPGPDTVECSNCGIDIRLTAKVCHNCGSDNDRRPGRSISTLHDPTNLETTVSDNWYYGIAAGVGLWVIALLFSGLSETGAGFAMLIAWVVLPLTAYFDMQYIRANSKWNPNTLAWIVGLLIPFLNILLGGVFLYRRHETVGTF